MFYFIYFVSCLVCFRLDLLFVLSIYYPVFVYVCLSVGYLRPFRACTVVGMRRQCSPASLDLSIQLSRLAWRLSFLGWARMFEFRWSRLDRHWPVNAVKGDWSGAHRAVVWGQAACITDTPSPCLRHHGAACADLLLLQPSHHVPPGPGCWTWL